MCVLRWRARKALCTKATALEGLLPGVDGLVLGEELDLAEGLPALAAHVQLLAHMHAPVLGEG